MRAKVNRPDHHRATASRIAPAAPSRGSISVVMTAYNHEKYIAEAIESILGQTYGDFEFIIVNDGSTDGTEEIIRGFHDRRITCISQANQGESAAVNLGCAVATGAYIALMDGDDVSHPMRLERQRHLLLSQQARAVTSWVALIDDDGEPLDEYLGLMEVINTPPSCTRQESLRRLWSGNYLSSSSAMLDRSLFHEVGGYCRTSAQVQDYLLWIEILKRTHIHTIPEPLIRYRIRSGAANISLDPGNASRTAFELKQLYRGFFDGLPAEIFREAFAGDLRDHAFAGKAAYECEKAFLYLSHPSVAVREIGTEKLFLLMQKPPTLDLLADTYHFSMADFYRLENDPTYGGMLSAAAPRVDEPGALVGAPMAEQVQHHRALVAEGERSREYIDHLETQYERRGAYIEELERHFAAAEAEFGRIHRYIERVEAESAQRAEYIERTGQQWEAHARRLAEAQAEEERVRRYIDHLGTQYEQRGAYIEEIGQRFAEVQAECERRQQYRVQIERRFAEMEAEYRRLREYAATLERDREERIAAMESVSA